MTAARQLSQETLESSKLPFESVDKALMLYHLGPKLIKRQLGLTTHLADRAARLEWLIQFINDNGALNRLNIPLRTILATHAEKIAAAQGVWAWYDGTRFKGPATAAGVGSRSVERSQSMLVQAIELYQEEDGGEDTWQQSAATRRSGRGPGKIISPTSSVADVEISFESDEEHEGDGGMDWSHVRYQEGGQERNVVVHGYVDPVRAFFKVKVENIGELIPYSVKVVKSTIASFDKSQAWPDAVVQAGRLTLVRMFYVQPASTYAINRFSWKKRFNSDIPTSVLMVLIPIDLLQRLGRLSLVFLMRARTSLKSAVVQQEMQQLLLKPRMFCKDWLQ